MIKVDYAKIEKRSSEWQYKFIDWSVVELSIDGVKTHCVINWHYGFVVVHWKAGGSRYMLLGDYENMEGDFKSFIEQELENSKPLSKLSFTDNGIFEDGVPLPNERGQIESMIKEPKDIFEGFSIFDVEKLI